MRRCYPARRGMRRGPFALLSNPGVGTRPAKCTWGAGSGAVSEQPRGVGQGAMHTPGMRGSLRRSSSATVVHMHRIAEMSHEDLEGFRLAGPEEQARMLGSEEMAPL